MARPSALEELLPRFIMLALIWFNLQPTRAMRFDIKHLEQTLDANQQLVNASAAAGSLAAGQMFGGRFRLEKKLGYFNGTGIWRFGATYGLNPLKHTWSREARLGRGSFGEAWEATGVVKVHGRPIEKTVVLKIFYRNQGEGPNDAVTYLTRSNLNAQERNEVDSIRKECNVVMSIITSAQGDVGEDRFVACYEVVIGGAHDPLYVILGKGGQSLDKWVDEQAAARRQPHNEARKIIGHLLQAIRTMSEDLNPRLTHHDLKPANAVFDGATARLIDFGATLEVRPGAKQRGIGTPGYAAPEFLGLIGYQVNYLEPAWSYDIFAIGMMYAEFMCPIVSVRNFDGLVGWARERDAYKSRKRPFAAVGCSVPLADIQLMESMIAFNAQDRPSPSRVLGHAVFARIHAAIGEGGGRRVGNANKKGEAMLRESIAIFGVKQAQGNGLQLGFDPQAAAQQRDAKTWVHGYQCEYELEELTSAVKSPHNTRDQCELGCRRYYLSNKPSVDRKLSQTSRPATLCCELVYDTKYEGFRSCVVGYGGTFPNSFRKGGDYAKEFSTGFSSDERTWKLSFSLVPFYNSVKEYLRGKPGFDKECARSDSHGPIEPRRLTNKMRDARKNINYRSCHAICEEEAARLGDQWCCEYSWVRPEELDQKGQIKRVTEECHLWDTVRLIDLRANSSQAEFYWHGRRNAWITSNR